MRTLLPTLLLLLGLAACGEATDDTDGTSATPEESSTPTGETCESIWEAGETLPKDYDGCTDAAGADQPVEKQRCSSEQFVVTYDDRFYAVPGAVINEAQGSLSADKKFQAAMRRCQG